MQRLEKEKFMSNTQQQDRVLSRLNARELSAKELDAIAGGFVAGTGLCSLGPVPNLGVTSDGDCDCPTYR
jgi:hypothetical protein